MPVVAPRNVLSYASASIEPKSRLSVSALVSFLFAILLPILLLKLSGTEAPRWIYVVLPLLVLGMNYIAAFRLLNEPAYVRGDMLVVFGVMISGLCAMFALLIATFG